MVTMTALVRARAGDGEAFRELTDPYRRELQLHCYRILGSVQDAEDMLQETLLAAWRGLDRFEERASMRAWLYKIATNRCLNSLRDQRAGGPRSRPSPGRGRRRPSPPAGPSRCGCSRTRTRCSTTCPTPRRARKPATSPGRRWRSRSPPGCSGCRRASARCWSCATCSATPPPRRRTSSRHRDIGQQRPAAGRATLERAGRDGRRDPAPPPGSPRERAVIDRFATRSRPPTPPGWSPCSPTTRG